MDKRMKELTYMWREMNDDWYRIQTNSPTVINKLKRRKDVEICGKTTRGSRVYWLIFRIQYKKPATARDSLYRLTNCGDNITVRNGVYRAESSTYGSIQKDVKYEK